MLAYKRLWNRFYMKDISKWNISPCSSLTSPRLGKKNPNMNVEIVFLKAFDLLVVQMLWACNQQHQHISWQWFPKKLAITNFKAFQAEMHVERRIWLNNILLTFSTSIRMFINRQGISFSVGGLSTGSRKFWIYSLKKILRCLSCRSRNQ